MKTRSCQNSGKSKYCMGEFEITPDDFKFYEKIDVPPPTFCPTCRIKMRLASLNHRGLFIGKCSKCQKEIPSMYPKDTIFTVYCTECYFSDNWDASDYFLEYDSSRNFFIQFFELLKKIPQLHIEHTNNNAGDIVFSNYVYRSKSVYLSYGVVRSENIYYSWGSHNNNKNCLDGMDYTESEYCYEIVDSSKNYGCQYLVKSFNCLDSQYLFDCSNCTNCFMSNNLRNKSYVFNNIQYTKDQYFKLMDELNLSRYETRQFLYNEFKTLLTESSIHKYAVLHNTINCTGDDIKDSKDIRQGFSIQNSENSSFIQITTNSVTDSMDVSMSGRGELLYFSSVTGRGCFKSSFCFNIGSTSEVFYCDGCNHVSCCFGCVGLKNKQYCILNKQYSKEEYCILMEKIKSDLTKNPYVDSIGRKFSFGDYFPFDFSRFPYNQSMSYEMFTEEKEALLTQGFSWQESYKRNHQHTLEFLSVLELQENYQQILKEVFPCQNNGEENLCTKSFKITQFELDYYIKYELPLPRKCPNCRYFERKQFKLPWILWVRQCTNKNSPVYNGPCENTFETSYSPDRSEKVYCDECYKREVL